MKEDHVDMEKNHFEILEMKKIMETKIAFSINSRSDIVENIPAN